MSDEDIRWQQRFDNYQKALVQLEDAVVLTRNRQLSNLEKQGLIQAFEFTYELAWNTLKDYCVYQGIQNIVGSRDTIREAFNRDLIDDGEAWMFEIFFTGNPSPTSHLEAAFKAGDFVKSLLAHSGIPFSPLDCDSGMQVYGPIFRFRERAQEIGQHMVGKCEMGAKQ